jgi:hypothetical protein
MLSKLFPVFALLLDQSAQTLVLSDAPALLRLVTESPPSAVAHLGISAWNEGSHLFKASILIRAETEQESVLFLAPSLLGLLVPF